MDVKRRIGDLDFDGEAEHRQYHQNDRAKKQPAADIMCVQIGSDHRRQCKTESKGRDRLDDTDQPQAFAERVDLPQEALGITQRSVVTDHCVMQVADQACQHGVPIAEIDHHQRDCWKQHANDQNVLLHFTSRHGRDGVLLHGHLDTAR